MSSWAHCEPRGSQLWGHLEAALGPTAVGMGVTAEALLQPGHLLPSRRALTYIYRSRGSLSSCPLAAPLAEDSG